MRKVTIYRSDFYLLRNDVLVLAWARYFFFPVAGCRRLSDTGVEKIREMSEPIDVAVPPLSEFVKGRLATGWDRVGIDAESVAYLASNKLGGFSLL